MKPIAIKLCPGIVAPRYEAGTRTEVECGEAVITEQGTVNNLPIVDLLLDGPDGKKYLLVLSGRTMLAIAAALRGVNQRNHGTPEP